jgi:hypothetical protein
MVLAQATAAKIAKNAANPSAANPRTGGFLRRASEKG